MSFEPEEISLKLDKSLTRADVENLLEQHGDPRQLNLSGLNLSVINFAEMDLSGAAFAYAHLNGANLLNANLEKTNLNSARLNGVKGHRARLDEADLANASLIEAKLDEASFSGAYLNKTNLSGADLRRASLTGANLNEANLSEADLSEANLAEANLSQANLSRAILRNTDLSATDLRGAVLGGAKLDGACLAGANLSQVRLLLANLHKAQLSQAILNQADFSWSDLGGANLAGAELNGAKLIETDLTGADLRAANLREADLSGANLTDSWLVGADLHEANLGGATLSGAYLSEEQKEMLASSGDILGLEDTRSAGDLSEFQASLEAARQLTGEALHTTNGLVHSAGEGQLRLFGQTEVDLEASASLPSLEDFTVENDGLSDNMAPREPLSGQVNADSFQPPLFSVEPPVSTVSLVVKEAPLSVSGLSRLLGNLDRLHTALGLIRADKFAELVEFYRSPEVQPGPGSLTVKNFDPTAGQIELTSEDPGAFPALNSLLAGISPQSAEISARELAENVLDNFTPGLDPVIRAIALQPLVENIRQLAAGPQIDLVAAPGV